MDLLIKIEGHAKEALRVSLPDRLVVDEAFSITVNGKRKTAHWLRQTQTLVIDEGHGLERRLQARSGAVQQNEPGGELLLKTEYLAAGFATPKLLHARVDYDVPGQLSRGAGKAHQAQVLRSQITGKILKISCRVGDAVKAGDTLLIIEAMKMENRIFAPAAGRIVKITVQEGAAVATGRELLHLGHEQEALLADPK